MKIGKGGSIWLPLFILCFTFFISENIIIFAPRLVILFYMAFEKQ